MREQKTTLEINDIARKSMETIELDLIDGAYCTKIDTIQEAYKYMLPGDTITIKYTIQDTQEECVDHFEVDYTFPETRINTPHAVKEEGTKFDRIITYQSKTKFIKRIRMIGLQQLFENTKTDKKTIFRHHRKEYIIIPSEIYFYSNYLSNRQNVAKKNIITINSDNEGFQP